MTPEPMPSVGTFPNGSLLWPSTVILTTAGLTLAATSITADDSSIVTGVVSPVVVPRPVVAGATVRSKAPLRSSTTTVPLEASTADSMDAARIVPTPGPPRRRGWAGPGTWTGGGGVTPPLEAGGPHGAPDA